MRASEGARAVRSACCPTGSGTARLCRIGSRPESGQGLPHRPPDRFKLSGELRGDWPTFRPQRFRQFPGCLPDYAALEAALKAVRERCAAYEAGLKRARADESAARLAEGAARTAAEHTMAELERCRAAYAQAQEGMRQLLPARKAGHPPAPARMCVEYLEIQPSLAGAPQPFRGAEQLVPPAMQPDGKPPEAP